MPYIDGPNDEKKYVPSKYAKEELPTWNEIYNEFYKKEAWSYDPANVSHQTEDLYWKVPHLKILLGWICNQFNKMIFEDGAKQTILDFINKEYPDEFSTTASDIRFMLLNGSMSDPNIDRLELILNESNIGKDVPPPIYTCEIPFTGKRSLFASNHPSININELDQTVRIIMIIKDSYNPNHFITSLRPLGEDNFECQGVVLTGTKLDYESFNLNSEIFLGIISELLKDIIAYFEGDFVGWKDANGNPINGDTEVKPGCGYQSGVDAAI
jgi:hypothetical protein